MSTFSDTQEALNTSTQSAFARWAYVDVSFLVADADTPVDHKFLGVDPEEIRWTPLNIEGAAYLYKANTRNAATSTTLWLRASAVCTARLLLTVEHPL